jgi:hypothetical protein
MICEVWFVKCGIAASKLELASKSPCFIKRKSSANV